jgi:hypothetical protein
MNLTSLDEWKKDKDWSDRYYGAIKRAIRTVASNVIDIHIANEQQDQAEATDYLITVETGTIACRIRRPDCKFRDFTLRAWRALGTETELSKIKRGFGRWYLYAWAKDDFSFDRWILVDLEKLRNSGLLTNERPVTTNPDRTTGFVAYSINELALNKCVVFDSKN